MDENSTTVKRRILELVKSQGFKVSKFFNEIGDSYENYKGRSLDSSPGVDILVKIRTKIPTANINWLLTGEGDMMAENDSSNQTKIDMIQENFFDALKRRDRQFDELLEQNSRLISVIENLTETSFKQSQVG